MSQERNYSLSQKIGMGIAGIAVVAASSYGAFRYRSEIGTFANEANEILNSLDKNEMQDSQPIVFEEVELSAELKQTLKENVAFINVSPTDMPRTREESGGNCMSFFVQDSTDNTLLMTAGHCLVNPLDRDGEARYNIKGLDLAGNSFKATIKSYYEDPFSIAFDSASLTPHGDHIPPGLELSEKDTIEPGQRLTSIKVYSDGELRYLSFFALRQATNGTIELLSFPEEGRDTCRPGVSGSGLVDTKGEVVGTLVADGDALFTIDASIAKNRGIDEKYIGSKVRICYASGPLRIREQIEH